MNVLGREGLPACLTFDFDAESNWIARDPANAGRPIALSNGTYGPKVGLGRILTLLDRYGAKTTFFVPGWVAERWPSQVEDIASRGHEIAHHGYLHEWPDTLDGPEAERELLERGSDAIQKICGQRPRGYRSPGEITEDTLCLLESAGFQYSSNFHDDDAPYLLQGNGLTGQLVELPYQFQLDDAPFCAFDLRLPGRQLYPPRMMLEIWEGEYEALCEEASVYFMLICHPQYVGRASRIPVLERLVRRIAEDDRAYFARCDEIAEACRDKAGKVENVTS